MFRGLQINRELSFLQFGGLVKGGGNYCNEKKKTIYDFSFINIYIYKKKTKTYQCFSMNCERAIYKKITILSLVVSLVLGIYDFFIVLLVITIKKNILISNLMFFNNIIIK